MRASEAGAGRRRRDQHDHCWVPQTASRPQTAGRDEPDYTAFDARLPSRARLVRRMSARVMRLTSPARGDGGRRPLSTTDHDGARGSRAVQQTSTATTTDHDGARDSRATSDCKKPSPSKPRTTRPSSARARSPQRRQTASALRPSSTEGYTGCHPKPRGGSLAVPQPARHSAPRQPGYPAGAAGHRTPETAEFGRLVVRVGRRWRRHILITGFCS